MHQRTDGLESVMFNYPLMFTPGAAIGMVAELAADEASKRATGKSFNQYGREYIAPYLKKMYMPSDVAEDAGGFLGDMLNPGCLIGVKPGCLMGGFDIGGLKTVNAAEKYLTRVRQRLSK